MAEFKAPGITIHVDADSLLVVESQPDGSATLKCRSMAVKGPLQVSGQLAGRQSDQLTREERIQIKDALIESVRSGAHGHMDPLALAESLKAAFSLIDRPGTPAEDGCKA